MTDDWCCFLKAGDLVGLQNLHPDWGSSAIVIRVKAPYQIYLWANGTEATIPWDRREQYITGVLSEGR